MEKDIIVFIGVFIIYSWVLTLYFTHEDAWGLPFNKNFSILEKILGFPLTLFHWVITSSIIIFILISIIATFAAVIILPPAWSLYGLFNGDLLNIEIIKEEIKNGTLSLRISSLLILYNIFYIVYNSRKLISNGKNFFLINQIITYSSFLFILMLSNIYGNKDIYYTMLSWSLLFILDDWVILSRFFIKDKNNITPAHHLKILGFNILLTAIYCFMMFDSSLEEKLDHGFYTSIMFVILFSNIIMIINYFRIVFMDEEKH